MVTTYFTIDGFEPFKQLKFFDKLTADAILNFLRESFPNTSGFKSATVGEYDICGLGGEAQPNLLAKI